MIRFVGLDKVPVEPEKYVAVVEKCLNLAESQSVSLQFPLFEETEVAWHTCHISGTSIHCPWHPKRRFYIRGFTL
jgi:hypothetical protein